MALSTTFFLYIHTRDLHSKLREMEIKIQPVSMISSNQLILGDSGPAEPTGVKATMKLLESTGQMSTLQPALLNNTRKAEVDLIFFNRVPKVGSQTLMELMRRLSIRNDFGFHQDMVQRVETIRLSPEDQAILAALISSYDPPAVYIKHVCFTNVSNFGLPEPIYINLVRDPVERVISWYYYVRAPWYYVERKIAFPDIPLPDPKWLKKDFEECVLSGDRECKYLRGEIREGIGDHRRQSMFFCGHHPECLPFNTQGALERAKRAVEQNYAVVGVLEDLNTTLTVFERYIPRFFEGASDLYWNEISRYNPINKNNFKPPVSEEVKNMVRKNFTKEIEFYEFCKQRLHKQYLALKLPDLVT
ncbi:heparan sulfate 2-O-sulfotransferase pipe isoform X2 [Diorhabda carinulata]|nr:heparan sulfate 2-O-sulfotransferase pipe [Diorhabda sublineata]XP_057652560.1 heparan sulfate 2-O-sulfotransferase pipe isoform X2 [Diorhabda carinulata]XP_057652561.1 heparan sulfate 2-O-sulfotransferase pipe isoform X2 [Diorhabda carinulata]XP_057652562.1 heparan sulfate 2-O-sulfotransferase pipe isoform X2 [Diorhabda carinulata]